MASTEVIYWSKNSFCDISRFGYIAVISWFNHGSLQDSQLKSKLECIRLGDKLSSYSPEAGDAMYIRIIDIAGIARMNACSFLWLLITLRA